MSPITLGDSNFLFEREKLRYAELEREMKLTPAPNLKPEGGHLFHVLCRAIRTVFGPGHETRLL